MLLGSAIGSLRLADRLDHDAYLISRIGHRLEQFMNALGVAFVELRLLLDPLGLCAIGAVSCQPSLVGQLPRQRRFLLEQAQTCPECRFELLGF